MAKRRIIKVASILLALVFCSQLMYQGGIFPSYFNFNENETQVIEVSDLSVETVIKTNASTESVQNKTSTSLTLDDIFISVKTTRFHHRTRIPIILRTWFQLAKNQTWFFTDKKDERLQNLTNNHLVNTDCPASHAPSHLCCKTAVEFDYYLVSGKKWFCHFDDDNYVNVPKLLELLQKYDYRENWYLGRAAVHNPLQIKLKTGKDTSFWYATGGAGYCISFSLALRILPIASGGRFLSVCENIGYPDDVTMGYIIELMANSKFIFIPEFHSHLEQMSLIRPADFKNQISFGYYGNNIINVQGFSKAFDPTGFLSLHCFLFPHFEFCPT